MLTELTLDIKLVKNSPGVLAVADKAVCVNPDRRLRRIAGRNRWEIIEY